jgi:hypothetical protein
VDSVRLVIVALRGGAGLDVPERNGGDSIFTVSLARLEQLLVVGGGTLGHEGEMFSALQKRI